MGNKNADILVTTLANTVCIKLEGRANFASSVDFKRLVNEQADKGMQRFVVDLSACQIMDSTFLGMMAGLGRKFAADGQQPEERTIQLLNPTERVADLIDNLGVSDLFHIVDCDEDSGVEYDSSYESGEGASKLEMSRGCLEAHQILMDHNPENVAKFKDVAKYFEEEVKKGEAEAQ